ncbi:MAG: beta-lactamase family protein, partial [Lachnospiraceae bacterium]|nr:beta-lactamase family protein [Lachnospiraceae bacterium]
MFHYKQTMDSLIQREVDEGRVKGASALVLHKDREVYFHTYGYANEETGQPMKRDTIIRLFSMSKPVTAVAVMILVERGELDVWDAVSKYIPEYHNQMVYTNEGLIPANRQVTIWDLLNMTSGIVYPNEENEPGKMMDKVLLELIDRRKRGERVDTMEYARAIAKVPLCFQPGDQWMYGYSADILGAIVEVVSGMRYSEFLKKELFEPLDMADTGFYVPEEKRERFAQIYEWVEAEAMLRPYT